MDKEPVCASDRSRPLLERQARRYLFALKHKNENDGDCDFFPESLSLDEAREEIQNSTSRMAAPSSGSRSWRTTNGYIELQHEPFRCTAKSGYRGEREMESRHFVSLVTSWKFEDDVDNEDGNNAQYEGDVHERKA